MGARKSDPYDSSSMSGIPCSDPPNSGKLSSTLEQIATNMKCKQQGLQQVGLKTRNEEFDLNPGKARLEPQRISQVGQQARQPFVTRDQIWRKA